jgi:hypothetical protein
MKSRPGNSHVGDPSAIDITPQGEQRRFCLLLWNESSRHHETTGLRPTMGTMLEVGHLPVPVDSFVA